MTVSNGEDRKILADAFRMTRELIGLSQLAYARLFEVERTLIQNLEEGELPPALDQRLLKFMLLTLTLQRKPEFIAALLRQMNRFYELDHIFTQPTPLIALFEQVLSVDLQQWPWILDSIKFRCKAIYQKRLGSFLLLWSAHLPSHLSLLKVLPRQTSAFINISEGRTVLILPSLYLFLNLDISRSNNPFIKDLELQIEKREPIAIALPQEIPNQQMLDKPDLDKIRLFGYSQDMGQLREVEQKRV